MEERPVIPFETGGALSPDSKFYIERKGDFDSIQYLQQMHYLKIIEPRQQGKTSLINRLKERLRGYIFIYIDFNILDSTSEALWYEQISSLINQQLEEVLEALPSLTPTNAGQWYQYLLSITKQVRKCERRIVVELDEIGAAALGWSENFFSKLRAIHNMRNTETSFRFITFVLAGAYDPRQLIKDPKVSPFNIARRISLSDFDVQQLKQLVQHLGLSSIQIDTISERIHFWTDGQPYLSQTLCLYLSELSKSISVADVDDAVNRFYREDTNNLPQILTGLEQDANLAKHIVNLLKGSRTRFSPTANRNHAYLELLGAVKSDKNGFCKIRNRIYEIAFKVALLDIPTEIDEPVSRPYSSDRDADKAQIKIFISYSHQDVKYLQQNSLLGYLSGLKREGFDFWHDERITTSDLWDERIKNEIELTDIALVFVSQAFLNSRYCQDIEISRFLKVRRETSLRIFPVILSPCDWRSYEWLSSTQCLPGGGQTIETHFKSKGKREGLYLKILEMLRKVGDEVRNNRKE
jgi:hypothetical protein